MLSNHLPFKQLRFWLAVWPLFGTTWAQSPTEPLPDPLTLEHALSLADQTHPDLQLAQARQERARAEQLSAAALTGTRLSAMGRLGYIDPARRSIDQSNNDSQASLHLSRRLYDFGYSEAREQAADQQLHRRDLEFFDARQQRRLTIMARYFDVLLADLTFARDNEDMAIAFIRADRARDRNELGQVSDVEFLKLESEFQRVRRLRMASEAQQRASRARLALTLNRPGDLPANLLPMPPAMIPDDLPNVAQLTDTALADNPRLRALRAKLVAARQALRAARKANNPVLRAEAEANAYERNTGSTHPFLAGLVLEVPLLTGGVNDAEIAQARADMSEAAAELAQAEMDLRQDVLDLWLEMDILRARRQEVRAAADYRELALDRSRAHYELGMKADLGDAMTQTTAVRLEQTRNQLDWRLIQARLAALQGRLILPDTNDPAKEPSPASSGENQ